MYDHFQSQIDIIAFDIGLNIFLQAWLIVFLANQFFSLINSKLIYKKIIILSTNKLGIDNFGYVR